MFHPVGSQPPSVYWRRRLVLIGAVVLVIVLLALTVSALSGGGSSTPTGNGPASTPGSTAPQSTTGTTTAGTTMAGSSPATHGSSSAPASGSSSAVPTTCPLSALQLKALTGKSTYKVGDSPLVELQVVNAGSVPCTRDLADKQIELRVYNGTSRVWGSHDCAVQPGSDVRTLAVGQPYRFAIAWGGLSSQPNCAQTTRQRVGAGSYTLYASLSGKDATAAQFDIG